MVKFLIERPIAVLVTFAALLILGVITARLLPTSLLPPVDIPEVTILASNQNMDAVDMENVVTKRLRQQLAHVHHLNSMESNTIDGQSIIKLKFNYGVDIDYCALEVNEQVDRMMSELPNTMERPQVIKTSADDIPVFDLAVVFRATEQTDMLALSELSDHILRKRLEQCASVAIADRSGAVAPKIVITPKPGKMKGITHEELKNAFINHNLSLGSIMLKSGHYQYAVHVSSNTLTIEDIGEIRLQHQNRIVLMKDLTDITIEPRKRNGAFLQNHKEGIVFSIIKNSNATMHDFDQEIGALILQFEKDYPAVEFHKSRDQSKLLNVTMQNLKQNLLYGFLLAFALMFLVLGSVRAPLLMTITIPSSLIVTLLIFYLAHISINIVSLSGLILGAGMMIDNSIIVIDNITQHRAKGIRVKTASIIGTNEVIRPLLSSVLTTCAVFIPLIFLSDISGALFFEQAAAITISLLVSYGVSIFIIPVLYLLIFKNIHTEKTPIKKRFQLVAIYESGLRYMYSHRWKSFIAFLLFIPLGMIIYPHLPKTILPHITQSDFKATIDWNEPITIEENISRSKEIQHHMVNKANNLTYYIGQQQFLLSSNLAKTSSQVEIIVETESGKLESNKALLEKYVRQHFPEALIQITNTRNVFEALFDHSEPVLAFKLRTTKDIQRLEENAEKILTSSTCFSDTRLIAKEELIAIEILFEKMLLYKVDYNALVNLLKAEFQSLEFSKIPMNQQMIPVAIETGYAQTSNSLFVRSVLNKDGEKIPIRNLIKIRKSDGYKNIMADQQGVYYPVIADIADHKIKDIISRSKTTLNAYPNIRYTAYGSWFKSQAMISELLYVLIVAIFLLYIILAAQFESLIQPLIVLSEVIIDISGAFLFLYAFGVSLNIMSAIGIVVMSGIIINDSIIKVDSINKLRNQGMTVQKAVLVAGHKRFNSIVMTSLTTILALVPLFFTSGLGVELQLPLAIAVIGGMSLGTIVSLYFIPVLYGLIYDRNK